MTLGAELTLDTVDHLVKGDLKPIPQEKLIGDIEPCPAPKIFTEDRMIDWNKDAVTIHNQVRGFRHIRPHALSFTGRNLKRNAQDIENSG